MTEPELFRGAQIHPRCPVCGFLLNNGKCAMEPHEEEE